jgi:predicted DNA repair protein MutK
LSIGLIALLDDIAGLAKVAAASLDDVAGQAAKAGAKAAGVVIDDAAVTPRYVVGFAAARELPIVAKIAVGSLRNKLLFLLPAALALGVFAPWAITPLLMIGGAFLCYEGAEKVFEAVLPHHAHTHESHVGSSKSDATGLEDEKVSGAIKTDFILSAEIMAITLAALPAGSFWSQAVVLAVVGVGITLLVYGGVAVIVKADDLGLALAKSGSSSLLGRVARVLGRGLVIGMPIFLQLLAIVGTAAMIWVGGGIIVHGLEANGWVFLAHAIEELAKAAGHAFPSLAGVFEWIVSAAASGLVGLVLGAALIPMVEHVMSPTWKSVKGVFVRRQQREMP